MKSIKKSISAVLAVMMVLCAFTAASFSAGAAETGKSTSKITVSSNLSEPVAYDYDENSEQITVTYYLQADNMIIDAQANCLYDPSVLKLASTNTAKTCMPIFSQNNAFINLSKKGDVRFNCSSLYLYNFKENGVFFTATFDIIGSGDTDINLNVDIITGTTSNDYEGLNTSGDIDYVYYEKIMSEGYKLTSSAEVVQRNNDSVSIIGDIALDLENVSGSVYTGTADLAAGTYKFKINANGNTYGSGVAFTDKVAGAAYKTTWNSFSTMTATGGEYTFTFDVATGKLTVAKKPSGASIIGDIELNLENVSGDVYSGTIDLTAGTYQFKIKALNKTYGSGVAFTDKVTGAAYKTTWGSFSTMTATGGTYTFTFDVATGKLTVAKKISGASIIGDIALDLKNTSESVYTGTTDLAEGTYQFKIKANGKTYGSGVAFTDKITGAAYKTTWGSSSTMTATGGTYTFTFDVAAGKLTVAKKPSGASIIGDIELNLENVSGDVYSGTIDLTAGTYQFKIKALNKTYGSGVAFTDKVTGAAYKTTWGSSSTMTATGGTYTFTFDVATGKLTVAKKLSGASIIGDIALDLENVSGDIYSGTTDLTAGVYQFKIKALNKTYGSGVAFTDKVTGATYKTTWGSSSTMTATGGTYTFTFDVATGKLTVSKKTSATAVSVIGDINLSLTETADGVYTGTVDLEAGAYQFKIKANGKTYGRGAAFTDKIAGAVYKTTWSSSSTMTATGGTYTFTFETNSGALTVSKSA